MLAAAMSKPIHLLRIISMTLEISPYADLIDIRFGKQRGSLKTKRDEIDPAERLIKPNWIRVKAASLSGRFRETKDIVRTNKLVTVCEEAACPNIGECWSKGTATFMIMGDKCTRRCRFCNVSTGRPNPLDLNEPERLAQTIALMKLNYVVITSVDRDDLHDGGAGHFVECIKRIRALTPDTYIEILTPDFGGRLDHALEILGTAPPDVLNHNIETVPRLYKEARPGADFQNSLNLLQRFKARHPNLPTKSGLMVGLGETDDEILQVLRQLRIHDPLGSICSRPVAICRYAAMCTPTPSRCMRKKLTSWASCMPHRARWCAVHTMRMSRHTRRVCFDSYESGSIMAEQVSHPIFHNYSYRILP